MSRHSFKAPHPWRINSQQAKEIQNKLRRSVISTCRTKAIRRVAGVDVGFEYDNTVARAAVAVLDFPDLNVVETAVARRKVIFPYIPGYLSFREVRPILAALAKIRKLPDLILCDGQGYAHPRRFGLACHLGVVTSIPTIGVAKTRLIGTYEAVGKKKGACQPLYHQDEVIGAVLRTRDNTRPLFISIGHKVDLPTAVARVLDCCPRYRLPETTRAAHKLASS